METDEEQIPPYSRWKLIIQLLLCYPRDNVKPTSLPKPWLRVVCGGRTSPALGISVTSAGPTVSAGRPVTVAWARLPKPVLHIQTVQKFKNVSC